jgi:hypothetical protein
VFTIEDGRPVFLRSTFAFVTDDCQAYFGEALSPWDIKENLKYLPDEDICYKASSRIMTCVVKGDRIVGLVLNRHTLLH